MQKTEETPILFHLSWEIVALNNVYLKKEQLIESSGKNNNIIRESINAACECIQRIWFIQVGKNRIKVRQDSSLQINEKLLERENNCLLCLLSSLAAKKI